MLTYRPMMLSLDGLGEDESIQHAETSFADLFHSGVVTDILGRRVVFDVNDWEHVCYKETDGQRNPYGRLPRDEWRPDRAARIPWIRSALQAPQTRVRPSHIRRGDERQSYAIIVPGDVRRALPLEFFGVFVRVISPGEVGFITAYTMDQVTFDRVKNGGPTLYPPSAAKRRKK